MNDKIIDGQFTNCCTGVITIKEITYRIDKDRDKEYKVLHLINGVTGYESVPLSNIDRIVRLSSLGWLACIGTQNKYDKLFIESFELITLFINEGIITVNLD